MTPCEQPLLMEVKLTDLSGGAAFCTNPAIQGVDAAAATS